MTWVLAVTFCALNGAGDIECPRESFLQADRDDCRRMAAATRDYLMATAEDQRIKVIYLGTICKRNAGA